MSESFFKIQLQRAVWVALLKEDKLLKAFKNFNEYKQELLNIKDKKLINLIQEEVSYCEKFLLKEVEVKAKKYYENKEYSNALICYKYIFEKNPDNTENITDYINCLEKLEQYDIQLKLAQYLKEKKDTAENNKILSKAYDKNKEYKKAIKYYKKYIELTGNKEINAADYNTIGCHYFNSYVNKTQSPTDALNALQCFSKALKLNPTSKIYLKNTIVAAMKAKDYKTEKACWETYFQNGYQSADDEFTYCASCLRNGDIQGWAKYYNSRFRKNEPTIYPKLNKPEYTGEEDISEKTLLIHYEQGYGDNFLMFGYMPRIVKLAKKVIYYVQNNAYDLLKNNKYGVQVVSQKNTDINNLEYDYHLPCMSLPIVLKLNKENISVGGGYIEADKKLVQKYRNKYFETDKLKIGIAFAGVAANKKRDIPFIKLLKMDTLKNVQLYCLTKDITDDILNKFQNNKVINIAKDFSTFADTAAAIENTDIIVSSDNCILNLAGAMGKRTLGVFNYHYEFRWYDLTGEDSGWYKSVKPIVNNEYNDWDISMNKAIEEIKLLQKERSIV